jgi:hypothetical protein
LRLMINHESCFDTVQYAIPVYLQTFEGTSLTNILWRVQIFVAEMKQDESVEDITFGYYGDNGYIINVFWKRTNVSS